MRRVLRSHQMLLAKQNRFYHYDPMSRAIVGSDKECPPPIHFKVAYLPDALPRTGHGFTHHAADPYEMDAITTYDNWEYKYYGQWWHMGSVFWNFLLLIYPFLLYLHVIQTNQNAALAKDDCFKKYFTKAGLFTNDNHYGLPKRMINY